MFKLILAHFVIQLGKYLLRWWVKCKVTYMSDKPTLERQPGKPQN